VAFAELQTNAPTPTTVAQATHGSLAVVVTNSGGARTGTLAAKVTDGFEVSDGCSGKTLAGGESCAVTLGYRPGLDDTGERHAHVSVTSADALSASSDAVFSIAPGGALVVDNADFGSIDPVSDPWVTVSVRNTGSETAQNVAVSVSDDPSSPVGFDKRRDDCSNQPLSAGAMCKLEIAAHARGMALTGGQYDATITGSASNLHTTNATVRLTAIVNHTNLYVTRSGTGSGAVDEEGGRPICTPSYCPPISYVANDVIVTLVATALPGSTFTGWTGACTGTGKCLLYPHNSIGLQVDAQFTKN
jgi:hypothetical protein